jgi:predicted transposase YdaD
MSKPFDATLRKLIELEPVAWLRFLHIPVADPARVKVIDSNISTVTAEADKVLWVGEPEPWIEHVELQASRKLDLPERVHWYSTIMRHGFKVPVHSTIILLRPAANGPELNGVFEQKDRHGDVYDCFRYDVVRVWEQPVEEVLAAGLAVLPLAPVSNVAEERVPSVLLAMSDRMARESSREQAATLWTATCILMGLRYEEKQVAAFIEGVSAMLFGIEGIEESSVYQGILRKGEAKGQIEEARENLLRLGRRKLSPPEERVKARIASITDLGTLHALQDRILDVSSWDELLGSSGE